MRKHFLRRLFVFLLTVALIVPTVATQFSYAVKAEEEDLEWDWDLDEPVSTPDPEPIPEPEPAPEPVPEPQPVDPGQVEPDPEVPVMPPIAPTVDITVSPKKASFGTVNQGESAYTSVAVTIGGTTGVNLTWIEVDNDNFFTVQAPASRVYMPGEQAVYMLALNAVAPGTYGGTLSIQAMDAAGNVATGSSAISATVIGATPRVDSVTITPGSVSLKKGGRAQFAAKVHGDNLPTQDVTWMVDGATSGGTAISGSGYLSVGSDESSKSLRVIAVAKADPSVSAIAGVTIQSDTTVHYVSVTAGEGGTVSGGGVVTEGEPVTVYASPSTGYSFYAWYDEAGNFISNKKKFTINKVMQDVSLTAVFERGMAYVFTDSSPSNGGRTEGDGSYAVGSSVVVKATPNDGYKFVGWKMNKKIVSKDRKFKLTNLDGEYRLIAVFEKSKHAVNVEVVPNGAGQVDGAAKYDDGQTALLKAYPTDGYTFKGWYSNSQLLSSDPSYKIKSVNNDYCIQAVFEQKGAKAFVMASKAGPGGTITPAVTAAVPAGANVTYVITPDRGYYISYLKVDGKDIGPQGSYVFNNVQSNHSIEAVFGLIPVTPTEQPTQKPSGTEQSQTMSEMKEDAQKISEDKAAEEKAQAEAEEIAETTDIDTLTGVLQEFNMTPAEAYLHFDDEVGTAMFNQAIKEGYFEMVISNAFSGEGIRDVASDIRTDSADIPNWGVVAESFIADEEAIGSLAGNRLTIHFDITDVTGMEPEEDLQALMEAAKANNLAIGNTFDITFLKEYNGVTTNIKNLDVAAEFVLDIPEGIKASGRNFKILHVHDGETEILDNLSTDPNKVKFEANKLSTFAFAYEAATKEEAGTVTGSVNKVYVDTINDTPAKASSGRTTTVVILVAVIILCSGLIVAILLANRAPKKRRSK